MATWRMEPDGHRTWYVPAHRAYAAAMAEDGEMTEVESERLAAAPREIDAKKANITTTVLGTTQRVDQPTQSSTGDRRLAFSYRN